MSLLDCLFVNNRVFQMLRRMRVSGQPLSRNKHFESFSDGPGRRALTLHRHLLSLERDAQRYGQPDQVGLRAGPREGELVLTTAYERVRLRRHTTLDHEAVALLVEGGLLSPALDQALDAHRAQGQGGGEG